MVVPLLDSEGWGVDLRLFCFCPVPTAAFPAGSWCGVPGLAGSVGKASGTRGGFACVWQVFVFLRSYFVLKNKYKPLQQVKTEIAARRKMPLLRILNKGPVISILHWALQIIWLILLKTVL